MKTAKLLIREERQKQILSRTMQDPIEVFVAQYFGLTNPQSEQKIVTTYADIVNLLAMFKDK